jgi:hypothetical protein
MERERERERDGEREGEGKRWREREKEGGVGGRAPAGPDSLSGPGVFSQSDRRTAGPGQKTGATLRRLSYFVSYVRFSRGARSARAR